MSNMEFYSKQNKLRYPNRNEQQQKNRQNNFHYFFFIHNLCYNDKHHSVDVCNSN